MLGGFFGMNVDVETSTVNWEFPGVMDRFHTVTLGILGGVSVLGS
jgi:hypothetical protein